MKENLDMGGKYSIGVFGKKLIGVDRCTDRHPELHTQSMSGTLQCDASAANIRLQIRKEGELQIEGGVQHIDLPFGGIYPEPKCSHCVLPPENTHIFSGHQA